jgi:hypothetical protein
VREKDETDQTDEGDHESIDMEKSNPGLAQTNNPEDDYPHEKRFKELHA